MNKKKIIKTFLVCFISSFVGAIFMYIMIATGNVPVVVPETIYHTYTLTDASQSQQIPEGGMTASVSP